MTKARFFAAGQSTPPAPTPEPCLSAIIIAHETGLQGLVRWTSSPKLMSSRRDSGKMCAEESSQMKEAVVFPGPRRGDSSMSGVQEAQRLRDGFARHPCSPAL